MEQSTSDSFLANQPNRQSRLPADSLDAMAKEAPPAAQLNVAVAELLRALSHALDEERDLAMESIHRAATLLDIQSPIPTFRRAVPDSASEPIRSGLAPYQIRKVSAHIVSNVDRAITNQELASIAGVSLFHFNRVFRRSFGEPPQRYILRRKIERAQGLMLTTDASLADIAQDCGLADQAHFGKLFRQLIGESPGAWRRARATGTLPPQPKAGVC